MNVGIKNGGYGNLEDSVLRANAAMREAGKHAAKLWEESADPRIKEVLPGLVKVLREQYEAENDALVINYPNNKCGCIKKIIINGETYNLDGECAEIEFLLKAGGSSLITKVNSD